MTDREFKAKIDELLEETLENLNKEFINSFPDKLPLKIKDAKDAFLITEEYLIPYLSFCKKNQRILKLVHQKPRLFQNEKTYRRIYDTILYPAISHFLKDETQKIYNLEFFTQGVVGIIHKWIELECNTEIEVLIEIIKNCVGLQKLANFNAL